MKHWLSYMVFFFIISATGQSINQMDANGKRHGVWKKYFDDTKILRYEGEFLHGKEMGLFKFYKNIDKEALLTATKQFNENDTKAYVIFYTSKGKIISEGKMDGKIYIGVWKYYQKNSNKLLILENYSNEGKFDGDRFVYYENGQIAEKQYYINGKLDGPSFWYSEANILLKEFIYKDDELHGISKYYNSKGELIAEGNYKLGKKEGVWKYYENGILTEEKDFSYKKKLIKKQ